MNSYKTSVLLFFVCIFLYGLFFLFFAENKLQYDEIRYWQNAEDLLNVSYGNSSSLWSGPLYPLILTPFRYFEIEVIYAKLLNVFLTAAAIVLFYNSINKLFSSRIVWLSVLALAAYYPLHLYGIRQLLTETFSFFLFSLLIFSFLKRQHINSTLSTIIISLIFTILMLTKVLFAYVLLVTFVISVCFAIKGRSDMMKIHIWAYIFAIPYLLFTYSITNKFFYWSNAGGLQLYWMTVDGYGDWGTMDQLRIEHPVLYNELLPLDPIGKDGVLKTAAINNIQNHPEKYIKNITYNTIRLFFNTPYSRLNVLKSKLYWIIPNTIVFLFVLYVLLFPIKARYVYPFSFFYFLLIVYLCFTLLLSAYPHFLYPIIPVIILLSAYSLNFANTKHFK